MSKELTVRLVSDSVSGWDRDVIISDQTGNSISAVLSWDGRAEELELYIRTENNNPLSELELSYRELSNLADLTDGYNEEPQTFTVED